MRSHLLAPLTKFLELDFAFYQLLVLARPVVDPFAFGAG